MAMTCLTCETGTMKPGVGTMCVDQEGRLAVLRHVPANVCDTCGEVTYNGETADVALQQMAKLRERGDAVAIAEFRPAPATVGSRK